MITQLKDYIFGQQAQEQDDKNRRERIPDEIEAAQEAYQKLFLDENHYLEPTEIIAWQKQWSHLITEDLPYYWDQKKRKGKDQPVFQSLLKYHNLVKHLDQAVAFHNKTFTDSRIENLKEMILPHAAKNLNPQQLTCLLKEGRNHRVTGGTPAEKALLVMAKIKLLVEKHCPPADILVLSATNAAAGKLKKRIIRETGQGIAVLTEYELASGILTKFLGKPPKITRINRRDFIRNRLTELGDDILYRKRLIQYFCYYRIEQKTIFDGLTPGELDAYLRVHPPITLNRERAHSYGAMEIANFLFSMGIPYEYRGHYGVDTSAEPYGQYHPDFYLPDEGIYIDFIELDKNGHVPGDYQDGLEFAENNLGLERIAWQRQLHQQHQTRQVEVLAYEHHEGRLTEVLLERLTAMDVAYKPRSDEVLWRAIKSVYPAEFNDLDSRYEAVISAVKQKGGDYDALYEQNRENRGQRFRSKHRIYEMIEPVYRAYQKKLQENDEWDFDDLLIKARQVINDNQYRQPYTQVLVPEYQHLSSGAKSLLKTIREQSDFELFCVEAEKPRSFATTNQSLHQIFDFEDDWGVTLKSSIEPERPFTVGALEARRQFVMKPIAPPEGVFSGYRQQIIERNVF